MNLPLFPEPAAPRLHHLAVGDGHTMVVREWGEAHRPALLMLHGGPGSGAGPLLWRMADARRWRLIVPDQRGAGLSTPAGGCAHNTTGHLLADLERLRGQLGVARWTVFGASWGATLALAHALAQPQAIEALALRALFLARPEDIAAFFAPPTDAALQPAWQALQAAAAPRPDETLLQALARGLGSGAGGGTSGCWVDSGGGSASPAVSAPLLQAWWAWEQVLDGAAWPLPALGPQALQAQAQRLRLQAHYLTHGCWLQQAPLLARCAAQPPGFPVQLLHGLADRICPPAASMALAECWPEAHRRWVPGAGHAPTHPALAHATVQMLAELRQARAE